MSAAVLVTVLVAGGVYLILQRELLRAVLGFILLGHGVNVLIIAAGGMARREPALLDQQDRAQMADPLPQAFVLTAIVIAFAITVYLLALLRSGGQDVDAADPDHPDGPDTGSDPDIDDPNAGEPDVDDQHRSAGGTAPRDRRGAEVTP